VAEFDGDGCHLIPSLFTILRYNEIFFMVDTCQAASMYEKFYSPNILAVGSSLVGEDSLSVRNLRNSFHLKLSLVKGNHYSLFINLSSCVVFL